LPWPGRGFLSGSSARKAGSLGELEQAGCRVLELDVTDEQSRVAAVRRVEAEHGAVGVLVNNAGAMEVAGRSKRCR